MFQNFALLLLFNVSGEILLLRRINTPFCNQCYSLPGGGINYGETARETVVREAKKSVGIDVAINDLVFKHSMYRKCNDAEFFSCFFQAFTWQGFCINNDPERYDDMAWFSLDHLPENMVPAHRYAIECIRKNIAYAEHGWTQVSYPNKY